MQAALLAGLVSSPLLAEDNPQDVIKIKPGPPAGFEEIAAPQQTAVDVFFGAKKIGSFEAIYTPKAIAFAAPEEIIEKIPPIKHDQLARVQQALTGDLPTNAALICSHNYKKKGCGILKPEVAGVIFYEDGFRAEVFIAPAFLESQDTHTDKILPPAPNVFSGIHTFNASVLGSSDTNRLYSLQDNSVLAYGPERLNMVGVLSNEVKQVNTFTAGLDKWGLDNEAGFFQSHPLQLIPQVAMAGVSTGTSLKTNLALRQSTGNALQVFLPQRSYVSLIYNNVIYSTDLYDAGNQVLNTSALPEGAYEVTIRIRDLSGNQTDEKRFFAKTFSIPPADQPIYFGQVGTVRDVTSTGVFRGTSNTPIMNGGLIKRITENSAIDTDFLIIKDQLFGELGAFYVLPPDHQFGISTLASSKGDTGFGGNYIGYAYDKKLSLSGNLRVIFAKRDYSTSLDDTQADPIQGNTRQLASTVAYQLTDKANIGLQANYTDESGLPRQYAYGPELRYDFWRNGSDSLRLTANVDNTQSGLQETVFLNLIMRIGPWGFSGQGDFNRTASPGQPLTTNTSGDARVTWNDDKDPGRLTVIGAETSQGNTATSYITDLDHRGNFGDLKLIASQTQTEGDGINNSNNTSYSGNLNFSIAHTANEFAWGGYQPNGSGLILKTSGDSADVPMQVDIDNSPRTTFSTGHSTPLFLSPYETYGVSIRPVQPAAIDYDGTIKNITLYPGNVLPLVWDINRIFVVLGHVTLPDGTPLADARLEEARNITVTDSEGLFQGELLTLKTITFKREAEKPSFFSNNTGDDFSIPPRAHPSQNQHSTMTLEAQHKAILDLFGLENEAPPAPTQNTPLPEMRSPPLPALAPAPAPVPLRKLRPAIRCRLTLPEVKETNGVYIYPDPLVCTPIPFEAEKGHAAPVYGPVPPAPAHAPAAKSDGAVYWQTFEPSEKQYDQITRLFADAIHQLPQSLPQMPQMLISNPMASKAAATPGQGGPFIPSPVPSSEGAAEMPKETVPATSAPTAPVEVKTLPAPAVPAQAAPAATPAPEKAAPAPASQNVPKAPQQLIAGAAPASSSSGFEAQVGSYRAEAAAKSAHSLMERKYSELAGRSYSVAKADLGEKGVYYRLRIGGFADKAEAAAFCETLSAKGQPCLPLSKGFK